MHRTKLAIACVIIGAFAAVALAQNADQNTAGPTRNDYQLGVIEPAEGATITGSSVRVVVNTQVAEQLGDPNGRRDVNSMPRPDVDVFLDGTLKGTLRAQDNVLQIDDVTPGTHKLIFVAKNRSNEIIDRKETHFSSVTSEGIAATSGPAGTRTSPATTSAPPPPPPPAPAYSSPSTDAPSGPAPSAYSPPPSTSSTFASSNTPPRRLAQTASHDPELAIGGAALLLAAFWLRRSSRVA